MTSAKRHGEALARRIASFHAGDRPLRRVGVHRLFFETAERHPDRIAIVLGARCMSYGELARRASRLAWYLRARGIEREQRVAVLLHRSPALVVALLGVLEAGGAYIPLDPSFPSARLRQMIDDGKPRMLLGEPELTDSLRREGLTTLDLAADWQEIETATRREGRPPDLLDAIYVIFTSGSTGRPKGIVQTHLALTNLIQWQNELSGIEVGGPVLQFSSPGFDVHLQEIFSPLAAGGTVCLVSEEDRLDPDRLCRRLADYRVGTAFLSVSSLTHLLAAGRRLDALPNSLRHLVTAGEQLFVSGELRRFLERRPGVRLHNHYGVSESHVVTAETLGAGLDLLPERPSIGRPLPNCRIEILDPDQRPVAIGESGEIWISGVCLARGYLGNEDKNRYHFRELDGVRWYRTGDVGRWLEDGKLEFLGRFDDQVKIDGRLVEIAEVEAALQAVEGVRQAVAGARESADGTLRLVAWYVPRATVEIDVTTLRAALLERLPEFMVPSAFVALDRLPVGATGKVDRRALPEPSRARPSLAAAYLPPRDALETGLTEVFADLLGLDRVGVEDHFFDLGATSLLLVKAAERATERLGVPVSPLDLFRHGSVSRLAAHLREGGGEEPDGGEKRGAARAPSPVRPDPSRDPGGRGIAVVGMAGRFPGAPSVADLWRRLLAGEECLEEVDDEALEPSFFVPSEGPEERRVRRIGALPGIDEFDAAFFGLSALEATWTDPQHRLFLECAWHALEDAGHPPGGTDRRVGVFAGSAENSYLVHVRPHLRSMADYLRGLIGNDKDFLATRVSYLLGLCGPALTVQTACSTSLVAVHLARASLLSGECDVALAGGVSIQVPQRSGHFFEEGLIYSADGRTRPFDRNADGTNITNGMALVVLKRLDDAVRDGDRIYAVLRGTAINNDGSRKAGYSAPSVEGQVEVIGEALAAAGVTADAIDFIEAHGTGTPLGDPIEVAALTEVFRRHTDRVGTCALGSIKGNIGHLNRAAGIAGFVKAVLSLHHGRIPPTLGYHTPNPALELERSPFFVPTEVARLAPQGRPARAGVSAFGIGGTNVHAVLEAWEPPPPAALRPGPRLVTLSARSESALRSLAGGLAAALEGGGLRLADVAVTCNLGRKPLTHRRAVTASDVDLLGHRLREFAADPAPVVPGGEPTVAFLFPGQGAQGVGIGRELYRHYPIFKEAVDEGAELAGEFIGQDLRSLMFAEDGDREAESTLSASLFAQTSLLVLERALAHLWMHFGVRPAAALGHSTGEYAAACVAGALSLGDALRLVAARARLMDEVAPRGSMTVVLLPPEEALRHAGAGVHLGAFNSREHTVLSGTEADLEALEAKLERAGVSFRRLDNHNPNHCALMAPMIPPFRDALAGTTTRVPEVPLISNLTGDRFGRGEAEDPEYWVRHLSEPVRFAQGLDRLREMGIGLFLEVGPRSGLTRLTAHHFAAAPEIRAFPSLPRQEGSGDDEILLGAVGRLWEHGVRVEFERLHDGDGGCKVSLPPYPFDRRRFWLPVPDEISPRPSSEPTRRTDPRRWLYRREACRTRPPVAWEPGDLTDGGDVVVVGRRHGLAGLLARRLRDEGRRVLSVDPEAGEDAERIAEVEGLRVTHLVHLCCAEDEPTAEASVERALAEQRRGLLAIAHLHAALESRREGTLEVVVVTRGGAALGNGEPVDPGRATQEAFRLVVAQEHPATSCRQVDLPPGVDPDRDLLTVLSELAHGGDEPVVGYRGPHRLAPRLRPFSPPSESEGLFRPGAAYLITGGLGRVGFAIARHLVEEVGCDLLLVGRTPLPGDGPAGDDPGSKGAHLAKRLRRLRASGREVAYAAVDLSRPDAIETGLEAAVGPWRGRLRGALHAAADIGGQRFLGFLAHLDPEELNRQIGAKCTGLDHLDTVLAGAKLDFRVVFSSLATVLGGLGYTAYTASNLAAAALAGALSQEGRSWQVVDWDLWDTGEEEGGETGVRLGSSLAGFAMAPRDALTCLELAVSSGEPRLLVSTADVEARVEFARRLGPEPAEVEQDLEGRGTAVVVAPGDHMARAVYDAWRRVLHAERIDGETHFVELGGDSLSAIQVVLDVGRRLGMRIPPSEILMADNFSDFVERVRGHAGIAPEDAPPPAGSGPVGERTPASLLQARWLDMERRGFGYLDMPVRMRGALQPARFVAALTEVLSRHSILRSRFERAGDDLVQVALAPPTPSAGVCDLRHLPAAAKRRALAATALGGLRFDLERRAPFAAALFRLADDDAIFYVRTHHIVFDGWSATLLLEELDAAYGRRAGSSAPAPEAPPYADFARWQRELFSGPEVEPLRASWRRHFEGSHGPLRLPASPGARGEGTVAGVVHRRLQPSDLDRLQAVARSSNDTLFTLLLVAYLLLLHEITGDEDLVLGTTSAGRHLPATERMIGVFVNPLPVRFRCRRRDSVTEVLAGVRQTLQTFHQGQRYLLADLIEHVPPFVGLDINETFHVYILFQNYLKTDRTERWQLDMAETDDVIEDPLLAALQGGTHHLMRDFELIVYAGPRGLSLNFWYRRARFTNATVRTWGDLFLRLLAELPGALKSGTTVEGLSAGTGHTADGKAPGAAPSQSRRGDESMAVRT